MQICLVIGSTISTIKDEKLHGRKLLIVREADETGKALGKPYVAVDTVDVVIHIERGVEPGIDLTSLVLC